MKIIPEPITTRNAMLKVILRDTVVALYLYLVKFLFLLSDVLVFFFCRCATSYGE